MPTVPVVSGKAGGVRQRLKTSGASASGAVLGAIDGRPGSIKRRLQAHELPEAEPAPDLPFNKALRRDWSSGKISSATVVEYAAKAAEQGASSASSLAGNPANAHRDLVRAIGYPTSAPEIDWIEIPDKSGHMVAHPVVCPLKWLEKLLFHDEARFNRVLRGTPSEVEGFWRHLSGHIIRTSNESRLDVERSIPCSIHGDGAPTTRVEGLFTISWSSMVGQGSTKDTRHVFTVIQKSSIGPDTLDMLFRRMAWSFNALAAGRMPQRDWKGLRTIPDPGRILASGWRLATIALRGDWEFFCQVCGFPAANSVPNMCFVCNASPDGPLRWTRGDEAAPWRSTLRSHEAYLGQLRARSEQVPGIFGIRSLRLEGVLADAMHTIDLGVAAHLCGNVMFEVMESAGWGATQAARAKVLQDKLAAYYARTKEKHKISGKLVYSRVKKSGDWPKFLGKAADTRRLVYFAAELASEHNSGSEHDRLRQAVADALARMLDILEAEPRFLSAAAQQQLVRLSRAFMAAWTKLSAEALSQGQRAWKMTPKFHLMQHIMEHQSWINPRYTWAYADEDLQRILKDVALSCHSKNTPSMVLFKWAVNTFDA